uniref:Uncharacterized protein n=1 Tax=viral metagenome TaxID=1070528 RepID=A0A6C0HVZ4_9ZZZZ
MEPIYILLFLVSLYICYLIFFKKETFINRKLENFSGDDLNVHMNDDLNVNTDYQEQKTIE